MPANAARKKPGPKKGSRRRNNKKQFREGIKSEIVLIGIAALAILLFLCNFNLIGSFGNVISNVQFGLFGTMAYAASLLFMVAIMFGVSNQGNKVAIIKLLAGIVLFFVLCSSFELIFSEVATELSAKNIYENAAKTHTGGGVAGGLIAYALVSLIGLIGTVFVLLVLTIICLVIITQKSFLNGVKKGGKIVYETAKVDVDRRRERAVVRKEEAAIRKEEEKRRRMDNKVEGVILDTLIEKEQAKGADIHEITLHEDQADEISAQHSVFGQVFDGKVSDRYASLDNIHIRGIEEEVQVKMPVQENMPIETKESLQAATPSKQSQKQTEHLSEEELDITTDIKQAEQNLAKKYKKPSLSLLKKNNNKAAGDSAKQLKETAIHLQQTLQTFGVKVTVTDISKGPSVTRFELQPEQGVKVSKIVGLADDIKLNLAATDIRIEAPIPGKAAVGIEVPNKENSAVYLRELLETKEFGEFSSNIAFAVGKDISGKVVVADIAKMPHMLIAGATGSGKSVCINTLIMSILYKAHPDDVKLIMIDPKVVELSVYNGIPHLMIPVVTDPKKAAGALHWGVAEMTDRYKKFADFNVRDLNGYNKKVEKMAAEGDEEAPAKLPQIVIIVDELADLMMVAPGEVEESICRLAQLARAAGIHLIIATQRPSVDVITGLIKANMPSRVAFSVSSGVDSRTILDMNGAEKLLGKGDMLFYPQGYAKPARIQGAFVSDNEVSNVVDFLKDQGLFTSRYSEEVEGKISSIAETQAESGRSDTSERDAYFVEAGKFIIEKDKASIGMLQRVFKIGFNRAARIMDQLADMGLVGEEEGTKPRKVLMSMEEFENFIEESL